MIKILSPALLIGLLLPASFAWAAPAPISENTQSCLECHESATPGIVAAWRKSRHAQTTPTAALKKDDLARRVSAKKIPAALAKTAVGCAECHTMNPKSHKDSFGHDAFTVHVVTTPRDCATCHPTEAKQYQSNIMSQAYGNLMANPLFKVLTDEILGPRRLVDGAMQRGTPRDDTRADACLSCHGTIIEVTGKKSRETAMGEMEFPVLKGWPNQGVGRINPDGSKGSCTSCHPRHTFSIAVARGSYSCGQCHSGPDVPAYKVWRASKHGNIFMSSSKDYNLSAVPWQVGKDFAAPSCAACHVSLLTNADGDVLAKRSHAMSDRLDQRLFGLIYAHAHPKSPDTSIIKAPGGLNMPTNLNGEPAAEFLIDKAEQAKRRANMQAVCLGCHATSVVKGQFARLDNTIATTNESVAVATSLMQEAWRLGLATDPNKDGNPFNEYFERLWVEQWLFYANSIRLASAMMGADYGAFDKGRWQMTMGLENLRRLLKDAEDRKKTASRRRRAKPSKPLAPIAPTPPPKKPK